MLRVFFSKPIQSFLLFRPVMLHCGNVFVCLFTVVTVFCECPHTSITFPGALFSNVLVFLVSLGYFLSVLVGEVSVLESSCTAERLKDSTIMQSANSLLRVIDRRSTVASHEAKEAVRHGIEKEKKRGCIMNIC